MAISKIQNISKEELTRIEKVIGESFVTNELFHNWGTIEERRSAVLAYMKIYVAWILGTRDENIHCSIIENH